MTAPDETWHDEPAILLDLGGKPDPSWLEKAFCYFGVTIYAGAIIPAIRTFRHAGAQQVGESDPVMAVCQYLVLLAVLYIMAKRWERLRPLVKIVMPYLLIVLLCTLSTLWSDFPLLTLRRSITLGVCVAFGIYCHDAFGLGRLIRMVSRLTIFLAALSMVVYVVAPDVGHETSIDAFSNAMRGVFAQKNAMSQFMVLGIACLSYEVIATRRVTRYLLSAGFVYGCIILCRSMSALLIATIVLVVTGWLILRTRPRARLIFAFLTISGLTVAGAVMAFAPDEAFELLGRDPSLTGRLPLWHAVMQMISDRPLLGYGYSGFWTLDSPNMQWVWQQAGWPAPNSHSGYLDIWLQIGIPGLMLYSWLWARIIRLAADAWSIERQPLAAWVLLFMLINVLANLDEGPLPWADPFTVLMLPALITMELWYERYRWVSMLALRRTGDLDPNPSHLLVPVPLGDRLATGPASAANAKLGTGSVRSKNGR